MTDVFTQPGSFLTFCWGLEGLMEIGPTVQAIVIIDVLRFTTCVSVAVDRGAVVLPYEWNDDSAAAYAQAHDAELAGLREDPVTRWSLSPTDLMGIERGTRLVLPSPNGSALSFRAAALGVEVIAGCLRNASAVGQHLATRLRRRERVAVIASGERWNVQQAQHDSGLLRPAVEDLYGAGSVITRAIEAAQLHDDAIAPEALAAAAAFRDAEPQMQDRLLRCSSGRELVARYRWTDDVETAAAIDADTCVPVLVDREYVDREDADRDA